MNLQLEHIRFCHGPLSFHYHIGFSDPITGVFGYSGSGKTTLLHLICGLEKPQSGFLSFNDRVLYDGERKFHLPVHQRNFGVVFQGYRLFPHMSVKRNLLYGSPDRKPADLDDIVQLMDLSPFIRKKPHQLSGGECQRVAIARSLLSRPGLLLMDEPFSNLDRQRRVEIICYLRRISRELKLPMIIISHDLEDLLKLSDKLVIVQDQSIRANGHYKDLAFGKGQELLITGT